MSEDEAGKVPEMHQTTQLRINWLNVNVPTIVALITAGWWATTYLNGLDFRLQEVEEYRIERSKVTDRKFDLIEDRMQPLSNMPYRVQILETQIIEANKRMDRMAETIINSIDMLRRDVNGLSTRVEVLANKIDTNFPGTAKPTSFRTAKP